MASWIGLLLEINHFGHFYESQLAKALVSLDFLGKLQPETLDEISRRSYEVRNGKAVDNPLHAWKAYFADIWERTSLATGQYARAFEAVYDLEYVDSEAAASVRHLPATLLPLLVVTRTLDYTLVSPRSRRKVPGQVSGRDMLVAEPGWPEPLRERALGYELFVDGKPVDISRAVMRKEVNGELQVELAHRFTFAGSAHVRFIKRTIEPASDYFDFLWMRLPLEGMSVRYQSTRPRKFIHCLFSANRLKTGAYHVVQDNATCLHIDHPGWVNPGEGIMVVPVAVPAADSAPAPATPTSRGTATPAASEQIGGRP